MKRKSWIKHIKTMAMVAIATMVTVAANAEAVTFVQITDDADCGITSNNVPTYTHALDFGNGPFATVNGLEFVNDFGVAAADGRLNSGVRAYGDRSHAGGTPPAVSGDIASVFTDMFYWGNTGYIELTGLTPGTWYDVRFYDRAWGYPGTREYTAGYDVDSDGSVEFTSPVINTDNGPLGNVSWATSYTYVAGVAGTLKINITDIGGYHLYGLTNQELTPQDPESILSLAPGALDIDLYAPATASTGVVEAAFTYGSDSNNVEITSVTVIDQQHSGAFSVVDVSLPLSMTSPEPATEPLSIQFDNDTAGLAYRETSTGVVEVVWNEVGGSSLTNTLPITATYFPELTIADTLYYDDFSGDGSSELNGTMPDVGANAWTAPSGWTDDGQISGFKLGAYLPFVPQAGNLYVLSGTLNSTAPDGWVAVGFTDALTTSGAISQSPMNGTGWFYQGASGGGETFTGPRTAGGSGYTGTPGPTDFKIVLDTRPTNWTVEWFLAPAGNSLVSIRGPVAWTANPAIQCIMLNTYHGVANIDKLSLTRTDPLVAHDPDPTNYERDVRFDLLAQRVAGAVSWVAPSDDDIDSVFGYDVYMDTNENNVINATAATPGTLYSSLGQTGTSFDPGADLDAGTTYYWRVDSIVDLASVPGTDPTVTTGVVWDFDVTSRIAAPAPNDGMATAALSTELAWGTPYPNYLYDVYMDTNEANVINATAASPGTLYSSIGQIGNAFDPNGLTKATTYYWRVDAVDASSTVYQGGIWSFSTYDTAAIQQTMIDYYDTGVSTLLANQKQPGYDSSNDPHDILSGQYNDTFNCRNQEGNYLLAFVYQEPRSSYYHDSDVLDSILLSLDYTCRAQGSNGGFNEREDQGGWCGVALPNGGNNTRDTGICTVIGFTMHSWAKCILTLQNEPAFVSALDEYIDNDGDGVADVERRDAYMYMMDNDMNDGSMTGVIQCMMSGYGDGGRPNQGVGAMAAVSDCNLAYEYLTGTAYLTQAQLDDNRADVLRNSWFTPWWSSKNMALENGHGDTGYDAGYGIITMHMFGDYLKNVNDTVLEDFFDGYMAGYKYYWVVDDAWPKGAYHEYRTARRQGFSGLPVYVSGICQQYHPAFEMMFDKGLAKYAENPPLFNFGGFFPYQLETVKIADLLLNWTDPVDSDYVLPCNDTATFTYTDSGANLEVTKTGAGPETVTWTAFNYDGGTKSYTYEPPVPTPYVTITESGGSTDVDETGPTSDTYTVVLGTHPANNVTVAIYPDDEIEINGNGGGNSVNLLFATHNWNEAQTVTVTAIDDLEVEGTHTSTITHLAYSSDIKYTDVIIDDVVVNITDNTVPDTDPPTPNPATFETAPYALGTDSIAMVATTGSDASGSVEYLFTCTAGGGNSSGWQASASYTNSGLSADTQYSYTVQMHDSLGNTGTVSAAASATTDAAPYDIWASLYPTLSNTAPDWDEEPDGMDNLMEYALGGNPTNSDAASIRPVFEVRGDVFSYIYRRQSPKDPALTYEVLSSTDLIDGPITNTTLEVGVSGVSNGFELVTNAVSTATEPQQFMGLKVEYTTE